jgi:Tfp pilus assembly protein PilF
VASTNESENAEGKAMLSNVLKGNTQGYIAPELIELALQDAVRRSAWEEAKQYRDQIPAERRGSQELLHSYEIEQGLGNNRQALSYARQMREKYPDNEEGSIAYTNALIEAGRKDEAERIINERLAQIGTGSFKSRYYYLRSRLQSGGEAALADLRSALFENPRNLDAILAMFEIYDKRGDERRAVYYLKQAIALAPTYSAVKNYEKKYAGKL